MMSSALHMFGLVSLRFAHFCQAPLAWRFTDPVNTRERRVNHNEKQTINYVHLPGPSASKGKSSLFVAAAASQQPD